MKAIWKGYLGFGLVNIPVALYSAVDSKKLSFNLLHEKDKGKIKYKRFCEKCGKEVNWNDIVKGLEVGKNEYYVISKEELEELRPEGSELIEIEEFVNGDEIDSIFYNKKYFIGPDEGGERSFFLFKETLAKSHKSAIAKFVLRKNEYVCEIKDYKKGLLLTTLNYAYEVRNMDNIPRLDQAPELKSKEQELATQLIEKWTSERFNITKYHDTFAEELKEAVRKKVKGEVVSIKEKGVHRTENLIETLKASLE